MTILICITIIYRGHYYFKRHNGKIVKSTFDDDIRGQLGNVGESYLFLVNEKDSLEEQIKTVLHELAHLGLEGENLDEVDYDFYSDLETSRMTYHRIKRMSKLEDNINKAMTEFYERNSPLVNHIRQRLLDYNGKAITL